MLIQKTSFFNLHELFPAFICANNTGSLINNLFGINIFNPAAIFFFFEDLVSLFQQ